MPYAEGRVFYDADSHLMELGDWLAGYADPDIREKLRPITGAPGLSELLDKAQARAAARAEDPEALAKGEERLMTDKGWLAMGAFDPAERSRVLDLLGFEAQLVFSTFAPVQYGGRDLDLLYGGTLAHNRAVADFCAHDERLLPVANVPLVDPDRARTALDEALSLGAAAVMVPSTAAGDRSPTHPDLHPFWATLEEAGVPFVNHIGGGGKILDRAFHNNDMPVVDHLGGGENIRAKDYMAVHHSPEVFLAAMILDGMFDRFPDLRGGCIEHGALWVPSWMRRLDLAVKSFARTEEPLQRLELAPSEYVRRHLKFTPFPDEPVDWLIEQGGAELFLFSSDYPHPEGGRDPLRKFRGCLEGVDDEAQERFYAGNFAEMMGMAPVTVAA